MPPRTTTALRDPRELMAAVSRAHVYYNISRCGRAEFRANSRVARRTSFRLRPSLIARSEIYGVYHPRWSPHDGAHSITMLIFYEMSKYTFIYLLKIH